MKERFHENLQEATARGSSRVQVIRRYAALNKLANHQGKYL